MWNCRHIFKLTSYHYPRLPSSLPACSVPKPSGWKVTLVNHTTSSPCVKHRVSFSHIARHTGHMAHFLVQSQHLLETELPSSGFLVSVLKKAGNPLLRLETYCSFSLIALPVYTSWTTPDFVLCSWNHPYNHKKTPLALVWITNQTLTICPVSRYLNWSHLEKPFSRVR